MVVCPGDGIGIRTGLRNQVLRVRVSPRAPSILGDQYNGITAALQAVYGSSILPSSTKFYGYIGRNDLCVPKVTVFNSSEGTSRFESLDIHQFKARSYNGYYRGLSIRRWEFDSPTSRQFCCCSESVSDKHLVEITTTFPPLAQWQSNRLITDRQKFNSSTEDQVFWSEWNNGVLAGCNPVASRQVGSIPTHSTRFCGQCPVNSPVS